MKFPIYFDYNATTPCDPAVVEAMLPWFTRTFGNPSSIHHPLGWLAEEAVEVAREKIASLIGAKPKEVFFTGGATEAINLAIRGLMDSHNGETRHIITVASEHRAVLDTCKAMEEKGIEVTYLAVRPSGFIDLNELKAAIRKDTRLIAVMMANNETGVLQPIAEIARIAEGNNVVFLSDAVQAAGKIKLSVSHLGIDLMPLSAHKLYGPKGVGILYVRSQNRQIALHSQITGGGQERGLRSGTLNVPGIVGFGKAAEIATTHMDNEYIRLLQLRCRLEKGILELEGTHLNGDPDQRLPQVSSISFEGVDSKELLVAINKELAVSSGSACSSITHRPSHVLTAMGVEEGLAKSTLRFSLGRSTTKDQVEFAITFVKDTLIRLRAKKAVSCSDKIV